MTDNESRTTIKKIVFNKLTLILLLCLLIAILLISLFSYRYYSKSDSIKKTDEFIAQVDQFIQSKDGDKNPNLALLSESITNNEPKNKQYMHLVALAGDFDSEYILEKDPEVRNFNNDIIKNYAKNNYEKQYSILDFAIPCSDPVCGQEHSKLISEILNEIDNVVENDDYADIIKQNLSTASYAPDNSIENKIMGFKLVYFDLLDQGTPEATKTAEKLSSFAKAKYDDDLK